MSPALLLDNSAWGRLHLPAVTEARADEIASEIAAGRIVVSLPFLLEAGYSARSARDHARLLSDLLSLDLARVTADVEDRALDAQGQLARRGHHRLPPVDVLTAALADVHGLGVLHYDADYDVILEQTDLTFASAWLAPRGSL